MLRITRSRQFRVSNRMAVMAALLLVITAAAGLGNPFEAPQGATPATMVETTRSVPASEATPERVGSAAIKKRKFKVNLYLFRRN